MLVKGWQQSQNRCRTIIHWPLTRYQSANYSCGIAQVGKANPISELVATTEEFFYKPDIVNGAQYTAVLPSVGLR